MLPTSFAWVLFDHVYAADLSSKWVLMIFSEALAGTNPRHRTTHGQDALWSAYRPAAKPQACDESH